MSNKAVSYLMMEQTMNTFVYEAVETTGALAEMIEHITTTHANQVALVTTTLYFETEGRTSPGRSVYTDPDSSTAFLLNSLRQLVRRTDAVFLLGHTLHFLLLGANLQGGEIVQTRLWDALLWRTHNTADSEILRPDSVTIGHSAYPIPASNIDELIELAGNVSLHCTFPSEKPTRKATARQAHNPQPGVTDEEWPALARKLGIPYLSLLPRKPPKRVQQLVNARLAQELRCYPIGRERNMLTVAMLNPQDRVVLERLHQETGLDIYPVLTHPQELQTVLEQLL